METITVESTEVTVEVIDVVLNVGNNSAGISIRHTKTDLQRGGRQLVHGDVTNSVDSHLVNGTVHDSEEGAVALGGVLAVEDVGEKVDEVEGGINVAVARGRKGLQATGVDLRSPVDVETAPDVAALSGNVALLADLGAGGVGELTACGGAPDGVLVAVQVGVAVSVVGLEDDLDVLVEDLGVEGVEVVVHGQNGLIEHGLDGVRHIDLRTETDVHVDVVDAILGMTGREEGHTRTKPSTDLTRTSNM